MFPKTDREALFVWTKENFPDLNILINNAGIQRMINLRKGTADLFKGENEIKTDLVAPIYLSAYFIPWFLKKKETAILTSLPAWVLCRLPPCLFIAPLKQRFIHSPFLSVSVKRYFRQSL